MPFRINRKTYRSDGNVILVLFILSGLFLMTCEKLEYERVIKIETGSVSNTTSNSATIGGVIIDIGDDGILQHGHCWSITPNPTNDIVTKTQLGVMKERSTFVSNLTGLIPGTTYYVRAYATNAQEPAYGNQVTLVTSAVNTAPVIHSSPPANIAVDEAYIYTMVAEDPDIGDVLTYTAPLLPSWLSFNPATRTLSGTPSLANKGNHNVTLRASDGEVNVDQNFTIGVYQPEGSVNDFQGNAYKTVKIGERWWMAENLKSTKLNDGTDIPMVSDGNDWSLLSTKAYCLYENNAGYTDIYGALYNWYTIGTGKLCPTGWHVPGDAEWTELTEYLGGYTITGGKLKETGTSHWPAPNAGASNESGFLAVPGGRRFYTTGGFLNILEYSWWWSNTEYTAGGALSWYRFVSYNSAEIQWGAIEKESGLSVRCIKN
jgi:uncharacterized protein (TIGR02145 family)